jgi:hypothetical protein
MMDGAGHGVDRVREADLLRILVVVREDPLRIAAHFIDQFGNVA